MSKNRDIASAHFRATRTTVRRGKYLLSVPKEPSPELKAACISVGKLAGEHERIRSVLMEGEPWPLRDVLAKLVEAGEILLGFYDYRADKWEEIHQAIERAKVALAKWPQP